MVLDVPGRTKRRTEESRVKDGKGQTRSRCMLTKIKGTPQYKKGPTKGNDPVRGWFVRNGPIENEWNGVELRGQRTESVRRLDLLRGV